MLWRRRHEFPTEMAPPLHPQLPGRVFFDAEGVDIENKFVSRENPRIFSYSELYIGTNGFDGKEVLGSGGFGLVYKAILPSDGTVVTVKYVTERGERFEKTFMAELVAVEHLRHRNLVRLRGWCIHDGELLLVYDYMPKVSVCDEEIGSIEKSSRDVKTRRKNCLKKDARVKAERRLKRRISEQTSLGQSSWDRIILSPSRTRPTKWKAQTTIERKGPA